MQVEKCAHFIEVFITEFGSVYQCDKTNNFILDFSNRYTAFKPKDFIDFTRKIFAIDVIDMTLNTSRHADMAIIMPHYVSTCYILTISDIIRLRDILAGAKTMLQLNTILKTSLLEFA